MTDARLPERFLSDRRLLRLSDADFRTYVMSLLWSVSNRTDGRLEDDDLELVRGASAASCSALLTAGLWRREGGAWLVTDYAATQTSAHELEVLENVRRANREAQARSRARKRASSGDRQPDVSMTRQPDSTGQARKARTGQEVEAPESDANDDNGWPEVVRPGSASATCRDCGGALDPALGDVALHPTCGAA